MTNAATEKPRTCRRCKGAGEYRGYGICYGCYGLGVVLPEAASDLEADARYRAEVIAPREARAAARKARMAARA